ncbi:MAG: BNR-4 repeat-containing protein [Akkermansiaceae bacterium]|nr:BNR-4 repeat-containing protein [Akkermansiaceae bacterium]
MKPTTAKPLPIPGFHKVLAASMLACGLAGAAIRPPYSVDAATLHLWQFDSSAVPVPDEVSTSPLNLGILAQGALLDQDSYPGFGKALSTADGGPNLAPGTGTNAYLAPLSLVNGAADNSTFVFTDPTTGAFTFEALLRLDFDPAIAQPARNATMQILSGEQDSTGGGIRSFQFRLIPTGVNPNADGFTTALPSPAIEFVNVRNGSVESRIFPLPANGPHTPAQGQWFHVAVSYDGHEGTLNNLSCYWTRIDPTHSTANRIGQKSLSLDLLPGAIDFAIGQIGRSSSQLNFVGLIDQVRISSIARDAGDFIFTITDSDLDQLPDDWEMLWFQDLDEVASADTDGDGFTHLEEYLAGTDPNTFTDPDDLDADGLSDAWEIRWFGHRNHGPTADPDGDGETNLTEFTQGSAPNNRASHANDKDADSLPDSWEHLHFASLDPNAGADSDRDGFSHLQELAAGTDPLLATSRPAGTAARLIPIDDGDPGTSEFGFGGNSGINTVSFIRHNIHTRGNQQFIAYYGRHQLDPNDPSNNRIWIARRTLGSSEWEVFRHPTFTSNNINDGHNVISFAIDGSDRMHMSWGMHGNPFHYASSTGPVTGNQPIAFGPDQTMTGNEGSVTYPQFYNLPDGGLLYHFREGGSGGGDQYLNRWNNTTSTWTPVHSAGGTGHSPFIKGSGWSPDSNAYPNLPQFDALGRLVMTWCWRFNTDSPAGESGYQTNHNMNFARSADFGLSWEKSDGTPYVLPINRAGENGNPASAAQVIVPIAEGSSLINSGGQDFDSANNPVIATWWAPQAASGNHRRQYMVIFRDDNGVWQTRQVSQRTNDPATTKFNESAVRDLGRPIVLCDHEDRIIVLYRDNFGTNGITVVHSQPKAQDPERLLWSSFELSEENLGIYEPVFDWDLWKRDGILHLFYQASQGAHGFTAPANSATRVSVLEWDVRGYFQDLPQPTITLPQAGADPVISFPTEPSFRYRIWSGTQLQDWTAVATLPGTGDTIHFTHDGAGNAARRFWRVERLEASSP